MTVYVVDASAGVDLLLDTAAGREIEDLVERGAVWWVPEHYYAEVMSLLRKAVQLGDITEEKAAAALSSLTRSDRGAPASAGSAGEETAVDGEVGAVDERP